MIGEDADDPGSPLDLLIKPLQAIGGSDTPAMLSWEVQTGQGVLTFALQQISHAGIFPGQVSYQLL